MIGPQTVNVKSQQTDDVHKMFDAAAAAIGVVIATAFTKRVRSRVAVQAKVRQVTTQLNSDIGGYVDKNLPQYYLSGANNANQGLRANDIKPDITKTTDLDKQSISSSTDALKTSLQEASAGMARSANTIISAGMQQQIRSITAEGRLNSDALQTIVGNVKQRLADNGISALVDKAGRAWDAGTYAEMAVKTAAVDIRNEGMFNRMLANGRDLVQVSNNGSDHPACEAWEGEILSISGDSDEYPSVQDAKDDGLWHPNCQHTANPADPDDGVYSDSSGDDEEIDADS